MPRPKPTFFIRPDQPFSDWFLQLFTRRETLWFFIWRDLKVQYNNPALGLLWSVFQPLVYFGVILIVVHVSGRTTDEIGLPFSLYLISGLAIWNFTTSGILGAISSIQSNSGIISKSFFPRFYLILAPIIKSLFDLTIMLLIVIGFAIYKHQEFVYANFGFAWAGLVITAAMTLGLATIAASSVVWNRHTRHAIPILLYATIFALPVFYSMNAIDNPVMHTIYDLNPVAGAMDLLRSAFVNSTPHIQTATLWFLQSLIWLTIGITLFRKTEKTLADQV